MYMKRLLVHFPDAFAELDQLLLRSENITFIALVTSGRVIPMASQGESLLSTE